MTTSLLKTPSIARVSFAAAAGVLAIASAWAAQTPQDEVAVPANTRCGRVDAGEEAVS